MPFVGIAAISETVATAGQNALRHALEQPAFSTNVQIEAEDSDGMHA